MRGVQTPPGTPRQPSPARRRPLPEKPQPPTSQEMPDALAQSDELTTPPPPPAWRSLLQHRPLGDASLLAHTRGEPLVDADNRPNTRALYLGHMTANQQFALQCLAVLIRGRNEVLLDLDEARKIALGKAEAALHATERLREAVASGADGEILEALKQEDAMAQAELERERPGTE